MGGRRERAVEMPRWARWCVYAFLALMLVLLAVQSFAATCTSGQQPWTFTFDGKYGAGADGTSACQALAVAHGGAFGYDGTGCHTGGYYATGGELCQLAADPPATPASGAGTTITCGAACSITIAIKPEEPASAAQAQRYEDMASLWVIFLVAGVCVFCARRFIALWDVNPNES